MNATGTPSLTVPRWVLRWCTWYTRGLEAEVSEARQAEIASDLHEHRASEGGAGQPPWKVDAVILARAVAGVPADLSWRADRIAGGEVDRPRLWRNRRREIIALMVFLTGVAVTGGGSYLYYRIARALSSETITYLPKAVFPIIALTLVGALGCALLIRPASRAWGAVLLVLPSIWLPHVAMHLLTTISATGSAIIGLDVSGWDRNALAASVTLVVFFSASAAWNFTIRRRTPESTTIERTNR